MKILRRHLGLVAVLAGAAISTTRSAPPENANPALQEHVEVRLVEVAVRVVDRSGKPVTDVTPDQLTVLEGGEPRRIAYFESINARGPDLSGGATPPPTELYDQSGHEAKADGSAVVLPAKPRRRIVLAFDAANSKIRRRAEWKTAAKDWIVSSMQPDDQVAIVTFKTVPVWSQPPTSDKSVLVNAIESLDLEGNLPDRDRQKEMGVLWDELTGCSDQTEVAGRHNSTGGTAGGTSAASDEAACAFSIAEPYVTQWATETNETVDCLRTLTGQMAAMDGRKVVILFSEGIVPDPPQLAMDAMLGLFGANRIPISSFKFRLQSDAQADLSALHAAARAAGVVFYTFDTRSGGDRGYFETPAYTRPQGTQTLGINPWVETYNETSGALEVLAEETGGRSFYGAAGLAGHLKEAVDSYRSVFNLGFYRPASATSPGKLRIKVARKGVDLKYPKMASLAADARPARLEVSIRKPEPSGQADRQWLPVVIEIALGSLPLRRVGDTDGCQLGIFLQAVRPDGTIGDEAYIDDVVAIHKTPADRRTALAPYRKLLKLELAPGPYRLIARLSDDRQSIVGRRTVDLTLEIGSVRGGIAPPPSGG